MKNNDFNGKKVLVVGAGKSGRAAARFLVGRGAVVGVYDDKFLLRKQESADTSYELRDTSYDRVSDGASTARATGPCEKGDPSLNGVTPPCDIQSMPGAIFVAGREQVEFEKFDMCVVSPGVGVTHAVVAPFWERGAVLGELGLGLSVKRRKTVGVTGTNGKTTVTNMIAHVLGGRGFACGNVGRPVTDCEGDFARKTAVVEVSSFMLESVNASEPFQTYSQQNTSPAGAPRFTRRGILLANRSAGSVLAKNLVFNGHPAIKKAFDIGIVLNVTQDHLERHGSMQEYIRCKRVLVQYSQTVILNYDDENARAMGDEKSLYFSRETAVRGIYIEGRNVVLNVKKPRVLFTLDNLTDQQAHSIENMLAVTLACVLLGCKPKKIYTKINAFGGGEHRIAFVGTHNGVSFYNDSKATNIASALVGARTIMGAVNLIVGGQTKGQDFGVLFKKLPNHVERVFCYGSGADVIMDCATEQGFTQIVRCDDLRDATIRAFGFGDGAKTVLLSPACASLDEFSSYAERGERFTEIVKEIISGVHEQITSYDRKGIWRSQDNVQCTNDCMIDGSGGDDRVQ